MKKLALILSLVFLGQTYAASWKTKAIEETVYAELENTVQLKTFFMKKKKSSEYFINSLKQLTYRTFWNEKVVQGSVDIEEIAADELEFILDREFSEINISTLKTLPEFDNLSFYLGTHETAKESCIDLLLFEWNTKEAALYSECFDN